MNRRMMLLSLLSNLSVVSQLHSDTFQYVWPSPSAPVTTFQPAHVLHLPELYLVYFTASWCGPCKLVKAELDKMKQSGWKIVDFGDMNETNTNNLHIVVIDVDRYRSLQKRYDIEAIPVLVRVVKHTPVDRIVGSTGLTSHRIADFYSKGKKPLAMSQFTWFEDQGYGRTNTSYHHLITTHHFKMEDLVGYTADELNHIHAAAHGI